MKIELWVHEPGGHCFKARTIEPHRLDSAMRYLKEYLNSRVDSSAYRIEVRKVEENGEQ